MAATSSSDTRDYVNDGDEEDLPAVNLTPNKAKGFDEGSIVWCKWRKDYWPALVKKVYARQKKVQVVFADLPCDERGKEYKITMSSRNVIRFDNSTRSKELLEAGLKGSEELKAAIEKARDCIVKQGLGHLHISPIQFFIDPIDNVLAQFRAERKFTMSVKRKLLPSDDDSVLKKQNIEEEIPDEHKSLKDDQEGHFESDISDDEHSDDDEKIYAESIVKEIKTSKCLDMLSQIFDGKVESKRHNWFMHGTPSERRQLKHVQFSHIISSRKLEELIAYIRAEMQKRTSATRLQILNYTLDVWLPEALVYALQESLNVNKSRAEASLLTGKLPTS